MKAIIERKVYDTTTATEICATGQLNVDRRTRCTELYKTKKGSFFFYHRTMWQGEENRIEVVSEKQAADFYETCSDTSVEFTESFPNITIEEA